MRLSKSKYQHNIILKGGVLLSSIIGEDLRTTKDIDATLKDSSLLRQIFINYSRKMYYVGDVTYDDTIRAIQKIMNILESEMVTL